MFMLIFFSIFLYFGVILWPPLGWYSLIEQFD